jgi:DNA-binding PadR family transcriptional regulator
MPARQRSNPLALAVLACLTERAMHPYEMGTTMRTRGQDQSIKLNYGSLYTVVDSLARRGLIRARETDREGRRPARTVYEITEAGRVEFDDWLTELLGTPAKEYPHFEAGLTLMAGLPPDTVSDLFDQRTKKLTLELAALDAVIDVATRDGVPRVFLVEVEFERGQKQAELEFTRKLAADIASGTLEGLEQWKAFHAGRRTDSERENEAREE